MPTRRCETADVLIVGAGAAGLAAAIFTARSAPAARVHCLDGARRLGAKILVSGGSRCNVTNRIVGERDYWGGAPRAVRSVLRAFPVSRTIEFFAEIGVALHEEQDGKLFPDSHRSRTVLDALLAEAARRGVTIDTGQRVVAIARDGDGFDIVADSGDRFSAATIVLATGGRSLPKSGSDGFGYSLAQRLGHGYVETTPALVPLLLDDELGHRLSGIAQPAALTLHVPGGRPLTLAGALLWTHFGASGPVVLDMSRHWHRARLAGEDARLTVNLCPGERVEQVDAWMRTEESLRGRAQIVTVLASRLPAAVAAAWVEAAGIPEATTLAHLSREHRRRLATLLTEMPLRVTGSRGYTHAEVTAGGIPLGEIDNATMESRICPGLFLVGEMLDVDGRLGGFNFQWAWSSGYVAGAAIGRRCQREGGAQERSDADDAWP